MKTDLDAQLAGFEQMRQAAEKMPAKDRAMIIEQVEKARANLTSPAFIAQLEAQVTAERAEESLRSSGRAEVEQLTPANPRKLFARRLREFLAQPPTGASPRGR